jgi:hypothetical protein
MNRLNLLFFGILISLIHNYYSEFNAIFLQSFSFLFLSELISVKLFNKNKRNQINQDDDSAVSDFEDEENEQEDEQEVQKVQEEQEGQERQVKQKESGGTEGDEESDETEEEEDDESGETEESSEEPVNITENNDINQMEILRLLNNYDSLGDSGLMELKKKMLELDKLVEFYKNDTKKTRKE